MSEEVLIDRPAEAQARYGRIAILLHWLIAFALVFEISLGFATPHDERGFALIQLHKSVGIAILLLSLARLGWRLTHRPPPAVERGFGGFLAGAVHVLFYVLMIGLPLTGWALVSTDPLKLPTLLFGTIPWPHLPLPGSINEAMEETHELLAWAGIFLTVLHVAGALRHHILLRDGLLARIAPNGSAAMAGLLALIAAVISTGTFAWVARETAVEAPAGAQGTAVADALPVPQASESTEAVEEETEGAEETQIPAWTIQPGGRLGFSVAGGQTYRGTFSNWNGDIRMNPDKPDGAEIRITVNLSSASLSDSEVETTLQGPEFFASAVNPTATWRSTSVTKTAPGRYRASGTLTLKGVSKPQSLNFTLTGTGAKRHVEGSASIDRGAFGVGTGASAEGMASSVSLDFSFDAAQRAP